tara:strand:- start:58 stop:432 length:375 start_codon:yes stop_codon:yes gene_type:complete
MKMGTRKWNTWKHVKTKSILYDYTGTEEVVRQPYHFFGSNTLVWRTNDNILELLNFFVEYSNRYRQEYFGSQRFCIWKVNLPKDAPYDIDKYEPQVKEKELLGSWHTMTYQAWMDGETDIKLTG